ncbi:class I adenylate-forming enzyme family protein [Nitriliruptor alkaliphilus]|uniref:class I adenylate-forming enzyme family protein n=1 Tax=Nitriliruptor alkaliphilus TaxID=427918 RepID=UPI000698FE4D|nr:AMP-binding protein [Nitriliruptor alkaliphilus]
MHDARELWELFDARASATPDAQALVDEVGRTRTFGELRDGALEVAAGLAEMGVGPGTVVSWMLPTWIESIELVGALARLGAVQDPILPIYRHREVGFILRQARPALVIVPPVWRGFDYEAMVRELLPADLDATVLVAGRDGDDTGHRLPRGDSASAPPFTSAGDELPVRWLFYTSGTTADPKGAQHTDAAIRASATGMSLGLGLREDDRSALIFPFTHIGGQTWLWAALATGSVLLVDEAFDPDGTVQLLRREGVTHAGSGTYFHQTYLAAQRALPEGERLFPQVRTFPGGGSPKPPQLHHAIKAELGGAGIVSGYGLTEAPILTMGHATDDDELLATTEGRATPGVQLRLVTLDGHEAATGEEGEVRAKGPQITPGYLDPALDAAAFDEDGWFRTGDLGRLDAEGNLTITGRLKDVIIRKGENIPAKELEDLLFGHPAVADVAVIGLPDDEAGEIACAVVVPTQDRAGGAVELDLATLCDHLLGEGLTKRKLPERLELVDALPRNPAGKVLKHDLQARFG